MNELEALRAFAKTPLPTTKDDWPAFKEASAAIVATVAEAEATEALQSKLRTAERIAREIETISRFPWHPMEKRWQRIKEAVERLNELTKSSG